MKGPAKLCIFDGIMDSPLYVNILETTLLPFLARKFPTSHRFMADNDPKHTSKLAQQFLNEKQVNWWRTPAELPDLNPIENLWHELKEYIRREVKPKNTWPEMEDISEYVKLRYRFENSDFTNKFVTFLNDLSFFKTRNY